VLFFLAFFQRKNTIDNKFEKAWPLKSAQGLFRSFSQAAFSRGQVKPETPKTNIFG